MEVDGKQIQLLCLSINMLEICFKYEQSLPGYCDDVWGFELPPEDNLTICTLQTHTIHRVTLETSLSFYSTFMVTVSILDGSAFLF